MGNEEYELQQMIHLLMCSNEVDIEGLYAVSGCFLHSKNPHPYKQVVHPELFHNIIDDYNSVHDNLQKHSKGCPEIESLHNILKSGTANLGMAGAMPEDPMSEAIEHLMKVILKDDPRPLYLAINAGSNTLTQALIELEKTNDSTQMGNLCSK